MTTRRSQYFYWKEKLTEFCIGCGAIVGTKILGDCLMCTGAIRDAEYPVTCGVVCKYRALEQYKNVTERYRKTFGDDHPVTMESLHNFGLFLIWWWQENPTLPLHQKASKDVLVQSEKLLAEALPRKQKFFGNDHMLTEETQRSLAWVRRELKKIA